MSEPEPDVLTEESIVFAIEEPAAAEEPAATEEGEPVIAVEDEPVHNQILPYVNSTVVSIWSSIYPTFTRRRRGSTLLFKW